jgi:hypothetical protein
MSSQETPALMCCENATRNHTAAATGTAKYTLILKECSNQLSICYYSQRKVGCIKTFWKSVP